MSAAIDSAANRRPWAIGRTDPVALVRDRARGGMGRRLGSKTGTTLRSIGHDCPASNKCARGQDEYTARAHGVCRQMSSSAAVTWSGGKVPSIRWTLGRVSPSNLV